jgi:diguanylate cyclase (GGDEF)-like protein/PAS domain S-box-containing protein
MAIPLLPSPGPTGSASTPSDRRDTVRAGREALLLALAVFASAALVVAALRSRTDPETLRLVTQAMLPGALFSLGVIGCLFRVRLRGLTDARRIAAMAEEAERKARAAAKDQTRLRELIQVTNLATWEIETDGGEVVIDERWAAMRVHPEDRSAVQAALRATVAGDCNRFEVDLRMQQADGHWGWVASRGSVIERHPDGRAARVAGIHIDISGRKATELALRQSEARFRLLFEQSPTGICLIESGTGRLLAFNDAFAALYGYEREELRDRLCWDLGPDDEHGDDTTRVELLHQAGLTSQYEREAVRRDGSRFTARTSAILGQEDGRDVVWMVVEDITARKKLEKQLTAAVVRDRLTGLASRSRFVQRLQRAIARVRSGDQALFGVLFLDCDRFKRVNDAMGHAAGDLLLQEVAARLKIAVRTRRARGEEVDIVARFGGDEFLVLLNNLTVPEDATRVAERILAAIATPLTLGGRDVQVGISIGIVTSEQGLTDAESVIRNADVAMYEAKRSGRHRWVRFDAAMHRRSARKLAIESGLQRALDSRKLMVVYQPILDLTDGNLAAAEALVRWTDPELGVVSPLEFIPIAEESTLILALGRHVLRTACADYSRWQREDPLRAPRCLSVNVSRTELLLGETFVEGVLSVLMANGIAPSVLQLEVTEREVVEDAGAARAVLEALRDKGIRIAMDDFGTGTSSLACLRDFPFDVIKIDRSFVTEVAASPDLLAVMHATITLAENLGKTCVAEGVEKASQVAALQSLGCRYAQGQHSSRPLQAGELLRFAGGAAAVA